MVCRLVRLRRLQHAAIWVKSRTPSIHGALEMPVTAADAGRRSSWSAAASDAQLNRTTNFLLLQIPNADTRLSI